MRPSECNCDLVVIPSESRYQVMTTLSHQPPTQLQLALSVFPQISVNELGVSCMYEPECCHGSRNSNQGPEGLAARRITNLESGPRGGASRTTHTSRTPIMPLRSLLCQFSRLSLFYDGAFAHCSLYVDLQSSPHSGRFTGRVSNSEALHGVGSTRLLEQLLHRQVVILVRAAHAAPH